VLQLQCGRGEATAQLVELGALVTAVDDSPESIEAARRRAPDVAYVVADPLALPIELRRSRFDVVYAGGVVVERLEDPGATTTIRSRGASTTRCAGEATISRTSRRRGWDGS
jgi:SAM-dependent methyltransferase